MGIRIVYEYIKDGSSLEGLLHKKYSVFRDWLQKQYEVSRVEFNEQYCSEELLDFVVVNEVLPELSTITHEQLDDLITEFIGGYVNSLATTNFDPLESIGGHLSAYRYIESTELVKKYTDHKTNRLWQYLVTGRSLKDDLPFIPFDDIYDDRYRVGFWKREEWQYLYQSLISTFGTKEEIKERYWTVEEKREYEEALEEVKRTKQSIFSLSGKPISTGIECVLDALEEVEGKEVDIIFDVS